MTMLDISHAEAPYLRDIELPKAKPIIVIAGAYEGATIAFVRKYHPSARILAYEPQPFAYTKLANRFSGDAHVTPYCFALGAVDDQVEVTLYEAGTDAASILKLPNSRQQDKIWLTPAVDHLRYHGAAFVDLFVMNMEGYEYQLVPWLLNSRECYVSTFLVQWHFTTEMSKELEYAKDVLDTYDYNCESIGAGWELWTR